jgi:hypothetical protein
MNHSTPLRLLDTPRRTSYAGAIEWEELPSLAGALADRLVTRGGRLDPRNGFAQTSGFGQSAWDQTMPAQLDAIPEPEPFRETIQGMATREVREPEVFRHFFL